MVTVIWEHLIVVQVEFIPHGTTMTAQFYGQTKDKLREGVIPLYHNARPNAAQLTLFYIAIFTGKFGIILSGYLSFQSIQKYPLD